ncbi:hypothetical protein A1O3_01663 [Capronia epimyces CBS 606.96]|uniref:Uncharacterized protein n=1 Tax=Capronia epimyces CBS 606.96 TaxID=1182542 RepID=W9YJM0_9EURO|nr:uncharacterized protein A1O3_01663 [Capronia epimyces CBS 606.96]EXJ93107.1 hypothetical protein A1O3_01663 [Capronia epimyces CBS 606.96]
MVCLLCSPPPFSIYHHFILLDSNDANVYQTDPPDRYRWPNISARLQNLRNLLSSERHLGAIQQRAFEAIDREMDQMAADRSVARERRRRGDSETHTQARDAQPASDIPPQSSSSASLIRSRRRAFRPSERLQRYQRERLGQSGRETTSDLLVSPSDLSPASPAQSIRGERLRSKRRKLDDGSYEEEPQTFSYGHKGQVVSGQLRMEIASCDGGEYAHPHGPVFNFPQNVLQDDYRVYCTKANNCNLLLKHVGGMPFTLTQIVIKAPRVGYDAPIQEGMVFVAMEDRKLLDNTSQYDVRWSPKSHRRRRHQADGFRPSEEYLRPTRSPQRSVDRSRFLTDPTYAEEGEDRDVSLVSGFTVSVVDPSDEEDARESPPSPRPWHDDDYSLRSYVDRYQPDYLGSERHDDLWSSSSDSEGYEAEAIPPQETEGVRRQRSLEIENVMARRNRLVDLMHAQQIRDNDEVFGRRGHEGAHDGEEGPHNHRSAPSRTGLRTFAPAVGAPDPADPLEEHGNTLAGLGSKNNPGGFAGSPSSRPDVVLPHARFSISRSKASTSIKFDPPVSGRYILVKLWAHHPNANIDVQAILAYGYGGPRFFPSMEFR